MMNQTPLEAINSGIRELIAVYEDKLAIARQSLHHMQQEVEELKVELQCAEEDKLAVIDELDQLRKESQQYKESHETLQQLIEAIESGEVIIKTNDKCSNPDYIDPIAVFQDEYGCGIEEIPTFLGETEEQRIENYKELRDRGFDIREHSESGDGWKSQSITMTYNG